MANLNYAQLYMQALQQRYAVGLRFNALYNTPNNATIRWINSKTIQIPGIIVGGFVDVDRDQVGSFTRRADNDWETMTLGHDREFRTLVDPMDVDETNIAVSIANITRVFNDEQKIPEMDKYMASKLWSAMDETNEIIVPDQELSEENILGIFDQLMEEMDDDEVPQEGRIMYVTPQVNTMLKKAEKLTRVLDVRGERNSINRFVRSLDEVTIVVVPSSRMKTLYNFTDGAVVDDEAVQINIILIHPTSIVSPQKYDFVSLDPPSAGTGGKWLYYERKYWDIFVIGRKADGIKIVADASNVLPKLTFTCVAGTDTGDTKITSVSPTIGASNSLIYKINGTLPVLGEVMTGKGWSPYTLSTDLEIPAGNNIALVEIDAADKAVRGGISPSVPKVAAGE